MNVTTESRAGGPAEAQPVGMGTLREILIAAAVAAFFVLWFLVLLEVWTADDGKVATIDDLRLGAAAGLAGAIAAGFALAMGLEKKKPDGESLALRASGLPKLDGEKTRSVILTVGIWGYALVAGAALVTWLANQSETPDDVRALAIGFAGYVLSLATSAFSAVRATD